MNAVQKLYAKFRVFSLIGAKKFDIPPPRRDRATCFIFLAADYGNLGDVAITYAQKRFLKAHFPDHEVLEVPAAGTLHYLRSIKKQIRPNDIVTVVGGGNMGDMYGDIELLRLLVVRTFARNRIILFPQTIDYSDSSEAKWLERLSRKIYARPSQLTMCARESVSYETMKRLYPSVDVRLTPDIVMGLDERGASAREPVVTFCIRNDREKADNSRIVGKIRSILEKKGYAIEEYDTHIGGGRYDEEVKYAELRKIWGQFSRSSLVVTDRLHGMIFAYVTGTPAVVLPNSNFKVAACYKWIEDAEYIHMISDDVDIEALLEAVSAPKLDTTAKAVCATVHEGLLKIL